MKKISIILAALFLILFTFSCDESMETKKPQTALEFLEAKGNYTILIKALAKTNLTNTFKNPGSVTLFAPNDAAFSTANISAANIDAMTTAQTASLSKILQYHVINVGTQSFDLPNGGYTNTISTSTFGTSTVNISLFVNRATGVLLNGGAANGGATVTSGDNYVSNGVIHEISNVLSLPKVTNLIIANPNLSTLVTVLSGTAATPGTFGDQSATLTALNGVGPFTVFAPLNSAFNAATTGTGFLTGTNVTASNVTKVLQYHVSSTGNLTSSSATSWNTTVTDATITTLATQTFLISKGTVKITELPVQTGVPASNIKLVNIQATNGVIHTIDRVLKPVL